MDYYQMEINEVLKELETTPLGLSLKEAANKIKKFGQNITPSAKSASPLSIFLSQFKNPLIYIVLAATLVSFALGHIFDSVFIGIVLLINAAAGFVEEYRALKAVAELKKYLRFNTRVLRDGEEKIIKAEEVAVGDIIKLQNGDRVPADARLIEQIELAVDESMLTGESLPINKKIEPLKDPANLGDRFNMIFAGTMVVEGTATAVVTAVGQRTEIGQIIELTKTATKDQTPLQKNLYKLSKLLGWLVLIIVAGIGLWGFLSGQDLNEIFLTSLALAVSTIPEGLLPSITIVLVLATRRILKKKALVKKLQAAETLGAITVIATDKTGTLTMGEMRVSRILTSSRELLHEQAKSAYNANGAESHILALKITSLLSSAFVENESAPLSEWVVRGKPTDRALLFAAMEAGIRRRELENYFIKKDYLPFDSSRKYTAGIFHAPRGLRQNTKPENIFFIMGAPEIIFSHSAEIHIDGHTKKLTAPDRMDLTKKLEALTAQGLRVMAVAWRPVETTLVTPLTEKNCGGCLADLVLVGFIALQDPLRQEAASTIKQAREAGIRPIMVTGDHRLTAIAIAQELGFVINARSVIEGQELELLSADDLIKKISEISVFARISPSHKIKIVNALKARGEVVAMIGDGTNDAPALRASDVGVAVEAGTDVAKEAADVILFDNNFKTIIGAVEEGRTIFENIKKLLIFLLADDFSEIILFIGALAMGLPLPLLPAHILWINVIEDTFPNIALTAERRELDVMKLPPRHPQSPIFTKQLSGFMISVAIISGAAALGLFVYLIQAVGLAIEQTRTAILILMAGDSLLFAYSTKTLYRSIFHKQIFNNRLLNYASLFGVVALLFAIFIPMAQNMLQTAPPTLEIWALIGAILIIEVLLIEAVKRFWLFPRLKK